MDYVKLGNAGLDVSPICLGIMSFGAGDEVFFRGRPGAWLRAALTCPQGRIQAAA